MLSRPKHRRVHSNWVDDNNKILRPPSAGDLTGYIASSSKQQNLWHPTNNNY